MAIKRRSNASVEPSGLQDYRLYEAPRSPSPSNSTLKGAKSKKTMFFAFLILKQTTGQRLRVGKNDQNYSKYSKIVKYHYNLK